MNATTILKADFLIIKFKFMIKENRNHKPDCQCCCCKNKRGELSDENSPNYGLKRTQKAKDKQSKAMIGKYAGENNPMFGKKHKQSSKNKMSKIHTGENAYNWKGEEYQDPNRRWFIRVNGIKYYRARYIAMKCLDRELTKEEIIHHINEDKSDDRPENLYVFANLSEHCRHHHWKITPILVSNLTVS